MVSLCCSATRVAQTTGVASTTQPKRDSSATMKDGLVKILTRPYWRYTQEQWQVILKGIRSFSLEKRDREFAKLAEMVQRDPNSAHLRILILEHVGQQGQRQTYQRVIIYRELENLRAAPPASLPHMNAIGSRSSEWQLIEPHVEKLFKVGGTNNGVTVAPFDGIGEATVLSWFDGERWQVETWYCFNELQYIYNDVLPQSGDGVRPEMQAFFSLLRVMEENLRPSVKFAAQSFIDYPQRYGTPATAPK
jgi:hypothetical protein